MIYLMQSHDKLKIGYSKDCKRRWKSFLTGNPDIVLLASKPGDKSDETTLHKLCKDYHITNEWFQNVPEVHKIFNEYDPWHGTIFQKFQVDVLYYSTEGFWTITHPKTFVFMIPNILRYKTLIDETENVPEDVMEWYTYACNIMDVYAIVCWFHFPMFDLVESTNWQREYQLNKNVVYKVPYISLLEELAAEAHELVDKVSKSHDEHKRLYNAVELFIKSKDENSFPIKKFMKQVLDEDEDNIRVAEVLMNRVFEAEHIVKKIYSED